VGPFPFDPPRVANVTSLRMVETSNDQQRKNFLAIVAIANDTEVNVFNLRADSLRGGTHSSDQTLSSMLYADILYPQLQHVSAVPGLSASCEPDALSLARIDSSHYAIIAAAPNGSVAGVIYTLGRCLVFIVRAISPFPCQTMRHLTARAWATTRLVISVCHAGLHLGFPKPCRNGEPVFLFVFSPPLPPSSSPPPPLSGQAIKVRQAHARSVSVVWWW